ncbi:MAG TPA: beta-propeller domain-containing protein [Acetivibrio sp.]|nr:copper amine oxidase [Clostridium sp.]HOQ36511.1 beta-propeller domain-containing protein [Acetivibrio sp.]HPT90818.1 beta-propeller domain-containing protein [Acetivibrio sp.]
MKKIAKLICVLTLLAMAFGMMQLTLVGGSEDGGSRENPSKSEAKSGFQSIEERLENAVALYIGSSQALVNNEEKQVDSTNAKVKPYIKNDRTMVPVRFISENLGAEVKWDAQNSKVTVSLGDRIVVLTVGSKTMKVGDKNIDLDVAPEINEDRTYLPLRGLVEGLGKKVFYDRGLIIIGDREDVFDVSKEKALIDEVISRVNNLPVVGTYENLEKMFENTDEYNQIYRRSILLEMPAMVDEAEPGVAMEADSANKSKNTGGSDDYSTTNVQVQGVDEADVVKTDGKYIYQVNRDRIVIIKAYGTVTEDAYSSSKMKIMSTLKFTDDNFTPQELYIDGDYMVAIGMHYEESPYVPYKKYEDRMSILPYYPRKSTAKAIVFDIKNRADVKKLREVEVEGDYISSRKIDNVLYLITNKNSGAYYEDDKLRIQTPTYRDTAVSKDYVEIGCPDIRYFPDSKEANFLNIAAFDITGNEKANIQTYLGAGQNIYASAENLYVAVTHYNYYRIRDTLAVDIARGVGDITTTVYKFSLNGEKVTYLSMGDVPGSILNQYSMDENNGYFRIATTTGQVWGTGDNISKNNVYILGDAMNIVGSVEDMAPGEQIYSVRFMGDRGYVVTFRTVDPLFVIDLMDPSNPKILGSLKIPGYSDYLHPYDENHIIGFGKDTVEIKDNAYYLGMKIALFDVTDVENPIQKFSETIGDRGTDSELLHNPKALLFSKSKNLLAFPVTVMEVKNKSRNSDYLEYGEFTFQGAYVYNIDTEDGFVLKGRITHISDEEYKKAGSYYYNPERFVERILYIGDTLYTLSPGMVKANGLNDMEEKDSLVIPGN